MKASPITLDHPGIRQQSRWHSRIGWWLGIVACLVAASVGCSRKLAFFPAAPSNQPTEQRWIIGSIVKDCTNMATFAAARRPWSTLPADAVDVRERAVTDTRDSYAISIKLPKGGEPVTADLKIAASAWSPELYVPTLRALCARLKLAAPVEVSAGGTLSDADLLKALTAPLTAEIEAQNQRLSAWLQEHPLDARAHEQAALLLGTLAMRENSGVYWNPRGLCNRATAHLVMARTFEPEISACGEVAELLIGLIIDTKADCQKRIAKLRERVVTHPELGPWATAAALRNTRDYRLVANPGAATLLERIELFRATCETISAEQAIKWLGEFQPDTAPDWSRIVLEMDYGVDSGHRFALPSLRLEVNDAAQVFHDLRTARAPAQFAAVFNLPPGEAVQPDGERKARMAVIDPGTWAQFFQRHLLQAADQTYNFLQNKWGVTNEAKGFRTQMQPMLKQLTLYPLCLDFMGKEDGAASFAPAADLLSQHPEWVGDGAWAGVVKTVPANYAKGGAWPPLSAAWFSPRVPTGTVFGFDWRTYAGDILPAPTLPELEKLYAIAPLKHDVCRLYVNALTPGRHPTVEQYERVMEPLMPYYLSAMWGKAWLVRDDPAQYGAVMNRAALLNPNYYFNLGKYYLDHRMEPEAAQAYQAAIDHEADAVSISANCFWLVNYYYDHGQQDRAMTIARQVAEIYSSTGLETLANLLERMDRIKEAESYYEKIKERYNKANLLHGFYARQASAHPEYAAKARAAEKEIFPQGIQPLTLAQLSAKPTKGVLVHGENELSRQNGLKPGAIIVGIDGKRVRDMNQYGYIRALTTSPELDLLVYQDGRYQEIHARVPGRMFNLDFTSWPERQ